MTKVTDIDITWNKKFPCWCEIRGTELQSFNNVWWLILFLFFLRKIIVDLDMDSRARILVTSECVRYNWADTCQPSILVITSSNGAEFSLWWIFIFYLYITIGGIITTHLPYLLPTLPFQRSEEGKSNFYISIYRCLATYVIL